jgi:hypothetical protein
VHADEDDTPALRNRRGKLTPTVDVDTPLDLLGRDRTEQQRVDPVLAVVSECGPTAPSYHGAGLGPVVYGREILEQEPSRPTIEPVSDEPGQRAEPVGYRSRHDPDEPRSYKHSKVKDHVTCSRVWRKFVG